jgi:hypothetical protein
VKHSVVLSFGSEIAVHIRYQFFGVKTKAMPASSLLTRLTIAAGKTALKLLTVLARVIRCARW